MIHLRQLWFDFEISHALVFGSLIGGRDWGTPAVHSLVY